MGRAPGDAQLEQLLSTSASKIMRAVAWTSRSSQAGIEDRYVFSLEPEVIERLKPAFGPDAAASGDFWKLVPQELHSLTIYHQTNPLAAWNALNSAAAFKLDAVSAVIFSSVLRSGLISYAISNPTEILPLLGPPLATMRPQVVDESSLLIASAPDPTRVRKTLELQAGHNIQTLDGRTTDPDAQHDFTAVLDAGFVIIGRTSTVQSWLDLMRKVKYRSSRANDFEKRQTSGNAAITTFADDTNRVNSFIVTLAAIKGTPLSHEQVDHLRSETENALFSTTETTLTSTGIERKTTSPFGQFSTLASLAQADSASTSRP